jgi:hypothetical protein
MKMAAFWVIARCRISEVLAASIIIIIITLMMDDEGSEYFLNVGNFLPHYMDYNPEDSHLHMSIAHQLYPFTDIFTKIYITINYSKS